MINLRIKVLDGFRGIAILLVLLFHYFSRWIELYPYNNKYDYFAIGKMGVQFFFIISGFVILYTLENTDNLISFWKKRMIRLFPSMLIASMLTFFIFYLFDPEFLFPTSHYLKNVFASCLFIQPDLLSSLILRTIDFDYVSGSYWSLWPEIQFYGFISLVFYLFKNKFLILFALLSSILIVGNFMLPHIYINNRFVNWIKIFFRIFDLSGALPFFCFGVVFYVLYKNKLLKQENPFFIKAFMGFLLLFQIYIFYSSSLKLAFLILFMLLFVALIYFPKTIRLLENKFLVETGVASYFLYLIHENIGTLLIHKFGSFFKEYEFIFPLLIIVVFIMLSIFYTYAIDKKIAFYLKRVFFKKEKV